MFATQVSHKKEAAMQRTMGQHKGRMALVCVIAMAMFAMMTGVAFAIPGDTSATLSGGSLNISTELVAGIFSGTLTGAPQVLDADGAGGSTAFTGFSINDSRGTAVGWNVTMH